MSGSDLIQSILNDLKLGRFGLTHHARQRMYERSVSLDDIQSVGVTAHSMKIQVNGKVKLVGQDLDGDTLTVIAAYDGVTLIVTVL